MGTLTHSDEWLKDIPLMAMDAGGLEGLVCGSKIVNKEFSIKEIIITDHLACKELLKSHPHFSSN